MARKRRYDASAETPRWIITFSDIMTLLLTFFVMLVSMAVIDERTKLDVLGSVSRQFSAGVSLPNPTGTQGTLLVHEPGVMDLAQKDLEPLRDRVFDDSMQDLNFQENKYVQIFSINDEVLFTAGGTKLSDRGMELLNRLVPYLMEIPYPLLIAGHTGLRRDEEGQEYQVNLNPQDMDSTWMLSLRRAEEVYMYLRTQGIPTQRLSLEAFGQYHPRFTALTPEGRKKNRRVDLVLDKRNLDWINKLDALRETASPQILEHYYKGFRFDLSMPNEAPAPHLPANTAPDQPISFKEPEPRP